MKHSNKNETRQNVDRLLKQYKDYNSAITDSDKDRIGDEMTYADPVVWMMYKNEAYAGTHHSIDTLGALKEHSIDHGGICAKRFGYIAHFLKTNLNTDILDKEIYPDSMDIKEFYDSEIISNLISNTDFMNAWQKYEYFKLDGKVAKWQNYTE